MGVLEVRHVLLDVHDLGGVFTLTGRHLDFLWAWLTSGLVGCQEVVCVREVDVVGAALVGETAALATSGSDVTTDNNTRYDDVGCDVVSEVWHDGTGRS